MAGSTPAGGANYIYSLKLTKNMKLYNRAQIVRLTFRQIDNLNTSIITSLIQRFNTNFSDRIFVKMFRKSTQLDIKLFAPRLYYIDYDTTFFPNEVQNAMN